jgi:hypothetical protein
MAAVPLVGSIWGGAFLSEIVAPTVMRSFNVPFNWIRIGVGVIGGIVLAKFGGPLKKHAATFAATNVALGAYNLLPYSATGGAFGAQVASKVGSRSGISDYLLADTPTTYGQIGTPPQLYDYALQM